LELIGSCQSPSPFARSVSVPEPGPLPSTGITRFQQYYEPLRLLQWRRPLIVSVARGFRAPLQVSRVARHSVCTCHAHYPGERSGLQLSVYPAGPVSLRPYRGGSALASWFSRPSRASLALRPAHLQALLKRTTVPGASTGRSPFPPSR